MIFSSSINLLEYKETNRKEVEIMKVSVAPDMGMYRLLKNQNYSASYALAEFIDNSIQAHLDSKQGDLLTVKVKIYSKDSIDPNKRRSIVISDNGPGISEDRLEKAFKPASDPSNVGLSEFGIGMKGAAIWFTNKWELITSPKNQKKSFKGIFNLDELMKLGADEINLEEFPNESEINGTKIILHNVSDEFCSMDFYEQLQVDLIEFYEKFIIGDKPKLILQIFYNDTAKTLSHDPGNLLKALNFPLVKNIKGNYYAIGPKINWQYPLDFKFGGYRIKGFICLLDEGSYKNPGLKLIRFGRVIKGTTNYPYKPELIYKTKNKYGSQRIHGELILDNQPVSYTKDQFNFNEKLFLTTILAQPFVKELIIQTDTYRAKSTPIFINSLDDLNKVIPAITTPSPVNDSINNDESKAPTNDGTTSNATDGIDSGVIISGDNNSAISSNIDTNSVIEKQADSIDNKPNGKFNPPTHPLENLYLFGKSESARLDFKIPDTEKKLNMIVNELTRTKLEGKDSFPCAAMFLLRAFLELSCHYYRVKNKAIKNYDPQVSLAGS